MQVISLLFMERQCYIFMPLTRGTCAVAVSSQETATIRITQARSNNMSTL